MGSRVRIKTGLAVAALAALAGCGSPHSNTRAGTGPITPAPEGCPRYASRRSRKRPVWLSDVFATFSGVPSTTT
jgi:hypothetical protein